MIFHPSRSTCSEVLGKSASGPLRGDLLYEIAVYTYERVVDLTAVDLARQGRARSTCI